MWLNLILQSSRPSINWQEGGLVPNLQQYVSRQFGSLCLVCGDAEGGVLNQNRPGEAVKHEKKYTLALTFYFLCNKDTFLFHFKKYIFRCAKAESKTPPLTLPRGLLQDSAVILGSLTALSLNHLSAFMTTKHTASAAQPSYKLDSVPKRKFCHRS